MLVTATWYFLNFVYYSHSERYSFVSHRNRAKYCGSKWSKVCMFESDTVRFAIAYITWAHPVAMMSHSSSEHFIHFLLDIFAETRLATQQYQRIEHYSVNCLCFSASTGHHFMIMGFVTNGWKIFKRIKNLIATRRKSKYVNYILSPKKLFKENNGKHWRRAAIPRCFPNACTCATFNSFHCQTFPSLTHFKHSHSRQ